MLADFTLNKKKYLILCGGVVLLCSIFGMFYFMNFRDDDHNEQAVSKTDNDIRVKQSTQIEQIYYYTKCKEEAIQEVTPNSEFIGYDYKQFQQIYPQWNIELFTDDKIKMSLQVNDYCQVHKENNFIGISEGYVAIFCGTPDNKPLLREKTSIQVAKLHPQAIEEIEKGLIFSSKEEMLQFLEGIQSR